MTTPNKGTYTFADATSGSGTWEIDNSSSADYTFSGNMGVAFGEDDTWQGSDYWNILPIADGTITFDMQYQVIQNGQVIGDFTSVNSKQVTVEAPNLLSGKIYIYNFVLAINSEDVITFTVNNTSWIDGSIIDIAVENPFLCEFTLTDGSSVKIKDTNNTRNSLHNSYTSPYRTTLQHAEIGKLCTYIDVGAFNNCSELTSITIPNSVIRIGASAFSACTSHTAVIIPESVTEICKGAFGYCSKLANVTIPESVTSIGEYAFEVCNFETVTIPSNITSIGNGTFSGCTKLTSIEIPAKVTSIGEHVFSTCPSLESIKVDPANIRFDSRDNCNAIIDKQTDGMIYGCKNTTLPSGLSAQVVTASSSGKLTYKTIANNNGVIPKGVPVILVSTNKTSGTYALTSSSSGTSYTGNNLLHGRDAQTMTSNVNGISTSGNSNYVYYKLTYGKSGSANANKFGWYWGATNGAAFSIDGGKAWLALPKSSAQSLNSLLLIDDDATAIDGIEQSNIEQSDEALYNTSGQRVSKEYKGMIIRNGKKIIK